ncbi:MAG TPA: hypothetical protein VEC99_11610 [Clostridia bacterium]|nr:hypothetical protein [Clostridia bacterium]
MKTFLVTVGYCGLPRVTVGYRELPWVTGMWWFGYRNGWGWKVDS